MLKQALLFYPATTMSVTILVLTLLAFIAAEPRRNFIRVAMALCLAPLWPILAVRLVGYLLMAACDWIVCGRTWAAPFVVAARKLEAHL